MTKNEVDQALEYAEDYREQLTEHNIVEADARDVVLLADEVKRLRAENAEFRAMLGLVRESARLRYTALKKLLEKPT